MFPFYRIVVNENDDTGVDFNAFVDAPAHMKGFIAFGKDKPKYSFSEQDEKRIVTGVMISTGTPIYRKDEDFGEHYVVFDAPTVELIRKKFFKQGFNQNVNADHDPNQVITGATLLDSYIISSTDPKFPNSPEAFEHMKLQDGSWIASYHVTDDKIWQGVKNGTFNGFSVEGWFDKVEINIKQNHNSMKLSKFENQLTHVSKWDIVVNETEIKVGEKVTYQDFEGNQTQLSSGEYLTQSDQRILVDSDGVIQKLDFRKSKKQKMSDKKEKLWDQFKSFFNEGEDQPVATFAQATTAEGTVVLYEGELAEGTQVFVEGEDGQMPAPEGDHQVTLEDGTMRLITLDGSGIVTAIEVFEEGEAAPAVDTELRTEVEELMSKMAETFKSKFDKQEATNKELKAELATIKAGDKFKANPKGGAASKEVENKSSSQLLKDSKK